MQNKVNENPEPRETTLTQDLLALARYALKSRTGMLVIGGSVVAGGMFTGWDWLVAAGLAPVVLGVLPCAAMCAAGLCMNRTGGKSCSSTTNDTGNSEANTQIERSVDTINQQPVREIEKR